MREHEWYKAPIKPAGTVARVRQDFELDYIGGTWTHQAVPILLDALDAAERRCAELEGALFASRRAMKATRDTLTKTARREVHIYLGAEVEDDEAAAEWYEAALADTSTCPICGFGINEHAHDCRGSIKEGATDGE